MLTDKDREWLEKRKPPTEKPWPTTADDNFCKHCKQRITDCVPWYRNTGDCPTDRGGDFRDAAEFEARVAAKLSRMDWEDVPCAHGMSLFCPKKGGPHINCGSWCLMREARLAVEAEMEQENK